MLVFKSPLFYLIVTPKHKSSIAGNSDLPKRRCKVLPLSEKVKVLNKKKVVCDTAKIFCKNTSSTDEIVKKEKEIHANFILSHLEL